MSEFEFKPIRNVYLDYNATTPLLPEVKEVMQVFMDKYANPSSNYAMARENKTAVGAARKNVASLLNTSSNNIIFTSCGSESNNQAIRGAVKQLQKKGKHLITSEIEHPSVLETFRYMETQGFEVSYLKCNTDGIIETDTLQGEIREDTLLVSLMLANNETGAINPIKELCQIAHKSGAIFHCDAVQAIGKIPVDVKDLNVDLLSVSGHKLYAPKGIGVLYIKDGIVVEPLIKGGGQENGLRAGTENVIYIMALGKAAELAQTNVANRANIEQMRDQFEAELLGCYSGAHINSINTSRLPNTINISFPGLVGDSLVTELDKRGICVSAAAACKSGSSKPSYVLTAMGINPSDAFATLRISFGVQTLHEDASYALKQIKAIIDVSKG